MSNRMGSYVSALTSRHIIKVMREQYAVGICSCDSASMKVLALALEMRWIVAVLLSGSGTPLSRRIDPGWRKIRSTYSVPSAPYSGQRYQRGSKNNFKGFQGFLGGFGRSGYCPYRIVYGVLSNGIHGYSVPSPKGNGYPHSHGISFPPSTLSTEWASTIYHKPRHIKASPNRRSI